MTAKTEVTIIMPGTAAIVSQEINKDALPHYLAKLLGKAKLTPMETGLSSCLFSHFNQSSSLGADLPMVALESEGTSRPTIKIDPCYIHADRDRLLLFSKGLAVSEEESLELISEIAPLLEDIGKIVWQSAESWSLQLSAPTDIQFSALDQVEGKSVDKHLPTGPDKQQWRRLWNEIQMQLYNADVNARRIANKKLPINSVWFWGQGEFTPIQNKWTSVWGQSLLLKQLVDKSGHQAAYQPIDSLPSLSKGQHLGVLTTLDTESDWQSQLQLLDKTVFEPLWKQLSTIKINKLILQVPEFGEYHLTPLRRWQFWS